MVSLHAVTFITRRCIHVYIVYVVQRIYDIKNHQTTISRFQCNVFRCRQVSFDESLFEVDNSDDVTNEHPLLSPYCKLSFDSFRLSPCHRSYNSSAKQKHVAINKNTTRTHTRSIVTRSLARWLTWLVLKNQSRVRTHASTQLNAATVNIYDDNDKQTNEF